MAYRARDIMTADVVCVRENLDLREVTRIFVDRGITGAPVIDEDGDLVGVVSQTDVLRYSIGRDDELAVDPSFYETVGIRGKPLPRGYQIADTNSGRVADVMTPVVHWVDGAAALADVARKMTSQKVHRVIVKNGRAIVGIISALDVLKVVAADSLASNAALAARQKAAPKKAAAEKKAAPKKAPAVQKAAPKKAAAEKKAAPKKAAAAKKVAPKKAPAAKKVAPRKAPAAKKAAPKKAPAAKKAARTKR